jgi:hypothetical protein
MSGAGARLGFQHSLGVAQRDLRLVGEERGDGDVQVGVRAGWVEGQRLLQRGQGFVAFAFLVVIFALMAQAQEVVACLNLPLTTREREGEDGPEQEEERRLRFGTENPRPETRNPKPIRRFKWEESKTGRMKPAGRGVQHACFEHADLYRFAPAKVDAKWLQGERPERETVAFRNRSMMTE